MSEIKNIEERLDTLEQMIDNGDYLMEITSVKEFEGADVIISDEYNPSIERWLKDQNIVISAQKTAPRKRAVITPYSKELSWTFFQLRDIFSEEIDFVSKFDFYGLLAQSALDFTENHDANYDCKSLLIAVLNEARRTNDGLTGRN